MKRRGSLLLAMALILAAAGFAFGAERAENGADGVGRGVTLSLVEPLSEGDAQALLAGEQQEDAAAFTVWGELADRHISDPDLGRSVKADVIILRGDCELILPQTAVLASEDEKGCLIGEKTAWELFGSTKVVGDEVCIGTEARSIRGVVHRPEEGVIVMGSLKGGTEDTGKEEAPCYDRVTLSSKKAADGEAFLMQNGLEGAVLRFDYLRNLSWISGLVPGKWSDFSGWKRNYENMKQDVDRMMRVHKNSLEVCYEKQCVALMWNRALEIVCVWSAVVYLFQAGKGGMVSCVWCKRVCNLSDCQRSEE